RGKIDKTLFIRRDKGDILLVQVYVDDIIFGSTKKLLCTEFKKMMHKKFHMSSMGELTFFLGLQVKQKEDGIFISQDKYVTEILKKFGFTDVKTSSTPMETQKLFLKDEDGEEVDIHLYRSMIGSLMYLTSSRPDIMFAVCACARYQVNPKVSHLHAIKRNFSKFSPNGEIIDDYRCALHDHHDHDRSQSSSKTNSLNFKRKTARMSVKYPNYVNLTSSIKEQPNERTPSPPPRKKSLSPPQAPSKSISNKSTHYTSSSSPSKSPTPTHVAPPPKLCFFIMIKLKPQELPPPQISPNDPCA
ncbi:uncharacterized mitochondrial protein-like protein, partial [Tanacetum coccineum]